MATNFNTLVLDSPAVKRQKTSSGYTSTSNSGGNTNAYNSDVDDGDELFAGYIPDTPAKWETQPTQIVNRSNPLSSPDASKGVVQVPASSPFKGRDSEEVNPVQKVIAPVRKNLASSMAPAGTAYRAPHGIVAKPAPTKTYITIDDDEDDGPMCQGGSSDDDDLDRANIKPSTFGPRCAQNSFSGSPGLDSAKPITGNAKFQSIVANSSYKARERDELFSASGYDRNRNVAAGMLSNNIASKAKPSADSMSSGYGTVKKPKIQTRPERAKPIQDMTVGDISDQQMREKVTRLRMLFPSVTVLFAKDALLACKGSIDDAAALLADQPQATVISDDERPAKQAELQMKRGLKAPIASIRDKYSSTQALPTHKSLETSTPPKPKKRLVQGRRNPSSPTIPAISSPLKLQSSPAASINESYDSDSGVATGTDGGDPALDDQVLHYLNKCTTDELIELTNIVKSSAETMIEARPFKNLDAARNVANTKTLKSGKKSTRAAIGDKIVDIALAMFSGYEAIDALVAKCEQLGKPLAEEMAKWGFNVFGAAKDGELEIVSLEDDNESQRDSGIGSPISGTASVNGDAGDEDLKQLSRTRKRGKVNFLKKPEIMAEDCVLKDYQVVGLNWLALMYRHKLSCILADEMGLGKTCQVISFLSHLVETGTNGPHLVICPGSTLENWLREFQRFAPNLVVEPYYGAQKERGEMAERLLDNRERINVIVSTYDMAAKKEDNKFMRRLKPDVCVYDEGHYLKNVNAQRYQGLVKIPAKFRLLLTGTPLQNNLQELAALLAFILPDVFQERAEDLNTIFKAKATTRDADHAALLSAQRIARARSMLTPFVLRRKKTQVLKHLPSKTCRVEYCTLYPSQKEIYDGHLDQARERAQIRVDGGKVPKSDENNPLMQLRKASIHPLLFRRHFTNDKIEIMADILRKKEPVNFPNDINHRREHLIDEMRAGSDFWLHQWCHDYPCISSFDVPNLAWMDSGKVKALVDLVTSYKENGDRVLVFSQFALVLDILEAVLNSSMISFTRIDGSTKIEERQSLIDTYRDDESITAFLLTTKAGGTGINLMYANKVIIFDGSFNPQDDRQAENRAHRVGQTRDVEVVRLVTRGTVEEQIFALGKSKLELDGRVAGDEDAAAAEAGEKAVSKMFLEGIGMNEQKAEPETEEPQLKKENGHSRRARKASSASLAKKAATSSQGRKASILDMWTRKESFKKSGDVIDLDEDGEDEMLV